MSTHATMEPQVALVHRIRSIVSSQRSVEEIIGEIAGLISQQNGGGMAYSDLAEQNARLLEETQEMKRQLETRKLVERAKGIIQFKHNLSEEEAYLRLRNESRRLRRPMKELAEAIILAEDLSRKSQAQVPGPPRAADPAAP
jgi:hypothetical protein